MTAAVVTVVIAVSRWKSGKGNLEHFHIRAHVRGGLLDCNLVRTWRQTSMCRRNICPEDGCSMFLRNVSTCHSTRLYSAADQHRHLHCLQNIECHTRLKMLFFRRRSNVVFFQASPACVQFFTASFAYLHRLYISEQTRSCNSNGKHGALLLHVWVFQFCAEIAFALYVIMYSGSVFGRHLGEPSAS
jgi:hypothetical protein